MTCFYGKLPSRKNLTRNCENEFSSNPMLLKYLVGVYRNSGSKESV